MSENAKEKPAFRLVDYSFTEFSLKAPESKEKSLAVGLNPIGRYNPETGLFDIKIDVVCNIVEKDDSEEEFIKTKVDSEFKFREPYPSFAEVPEFFYTNALAILFPYIRAFISTLTLQSNAGVVMLPTLNLTKFGDVLKQNTKESKQ